jgi:hypothetical protein
MKKLQKVSFLIIVLIFVMACNLPAPTHDQTSTEAVSTDGQTGMPTENPDQATEQPTVSDPRGGFFGISIPTEGIVPAGFVKISNALTVYDPDSNHCWTYILLKNTSIEPLDIVKDFSYTMTWYDDQNQMVDQWESTNGPAVFPQETNLWEMWAESEKLKDHKIARAVFEVKDIASVNSFYSVGPIRDRVTTQPLPHPFFTIDAGELTIDKEDLVYGTVANSSATIKSALPTVTNVQVLAIYFNDKEEWIGTAKSDPVELYSGASATVDLSGFNLTALPVRAEYYPLVVSPGGDLLEVFYPGIYN